MPDTTDCCRTCLYRDLYADKNPCFECLMDDDQRYKLYKPRRRYGGPKKSTLDSVVQSTPWNAQRGVCARGAP